MIVDALFVVVVAATSLANPTLVESASYSFQTRHECVTFRALALTEIMSRLGGRYRYYIGECTATPVEEIRPQ
jgi:hypothetical protein